MKPSHRRDNRTPVPPLLRAQRKKPAEIHDLPVIRLRRHYSDSGYWSWENREVCTMKRETPYKKTVRSISTHNEERTVRLVICHREVGNIVNLTVLPNPDMVPNVSSTADGSYPQCTMQSAHFSFRPVP